MVILAGAHYAAQVKLEREIEDAIRAAGGHGFIREPKQR
jgi:hypothetical protein